MQDFANIPDQGPEGPLLKFPWLSVQFRFEGLLGQVVLEEYSYWADSKPKVLAFPEWQRITTTVAGAEPFEIDYSQPAAE